MVSCGEKKGIPTHLLSAKKENIFLAGYLLTRNFQNFRRWCSWKSAISKLGSLPSLTLFAEDKMHFNISFRTLQINYEENIWSFPDAKRNKQPLFLFYTNWTKKNIIPSFSLLFFPAGSRRAPATCWTPCPRTRATSASPPRTGEEGEGEDWSSGGRRRRTRETTGEKTCFCV